jgi:hypothetical protein
VGRLGRGKGEGWEGGVATGKGESDLGLGIGFFIAFFLTGSVWSCSIGLSFFKPKLNRTG